MNKKIIIVALFIIAIVVTLFCIFNKEDVINNNQINNFEENSETKISTENFKVNLTAEEDHYLVTIQTNMIEKVFNFSYDSNNFMLDNSSNLFDNAQISNDKMEGFKNVVLELESNNVYKLYFVKKSDKEMKLGKNLIIN